MIYVVLFVFLSVLWLVSLKQKKIVNVEHCNVSTFNLFDLKLPTTQLKKKLLKIRKHLLEITALLMIFILLSCRSENIGIDLETYKHYFNNFDNLCTEWNYELFFELLILIIKGLGLGFRWLLIVEAATVCIALFLFLNKFSKDKLLSILIIFSVGYFSYFACVIRQIFAFSILLIATIKLFENKKLSCIVLIVIAALFHKSAILFVVIPLLKTIKINLVVIAIITTLSLSLCFIADDIFLFLSTNLNISYFTNYDIGLGKIPFSSWISLSIQFFGLISIYIIAKIYRIEKDDIVNYSIWNMFIFILVRFFSNVLSQLFMNRINIYVLIYIALLIPHLLTKINFRKFKYVTRVLLLIVLFVYMYEQYIIDDFYLINPYVWGWN